MDKLAFTLTFEDAEWLNEVPDDCTFSVSVRGTPWENCAVIPQEEGPPIAGHVLTDGQWEYFEACEVATYNCGALDETMEFEFSGECLEKFELNECLGDTPCGSLIISGGCDNPPLALPDESYGCPLGMTCDAYVTPPDTTTEEASQNSRGIAMLAKTEDTGTVGLGITQADPQSDITVVEVVEGSAAYEAGIEPGHLILGVDGHWFYDDNFNITVDVNEVAEMIKGKVGSKVTITYASSDLWWMRLAICTRQ
jgi:hypothetical protein